MRPNLINRLKEEWNNLDPVDPLRGLIADAIDALAEPAQQQEPMFWYRPCSNGMYEGPIHNAQIERVRKESGAWHPLYTSPQPKE